MTMDAAERLSQALADRYRIERELVLKQDREVALKVLRPRARYPGSSSSRTSRVLGCSCASSKYFVTTPRASSAVVMFR